MPKIAFRTAAAADATSVSRIASQVKLHAPYGGVVPELASRNHSLDLRPLLESALAAEGRSINF